MPGAIRLHRAVLATALCCAWGGSLAQMAVEQARTQAGQRAIDRAQGAGMHAGLERAFKTPLEIVWLRTAAEADMWRDPTLAAAVEACVKAGAPKTGCAVVGRTAFRYVFGGNTPFASAPGEVARLFISSLNMPDTPLAAGRLQLAGSGRLYLVTPETPAGMRPTKGAVILAAGSTLQVSDALSPSILVELTAPAGEPLLLGDLAATDVRRILALLVKPGIPSAAEASADARGRVALRSGGEMQLAAILPADPAQPDAIPQLAVAPIPERVAGEQPLLASLAPALPAENVHAQRARASGRRTAIVELPAISGLERNPPRAGETAVLAALAPTHPLHGVVGARAHASRDGGALVQDVVRIASVGIEALQRPRHGDFVVASLAPGAPVPLIPVGSGASPRGPAPAPASVALADMDTGPVREAIAVAALAPGVPHASLPGRTAREGARHAEPAIHVAAALPVARAVPVMQAAAKPLAERAAEDVARLRAEVEAEVAREQERLAQRAFQPRIIGAPPARRFVLGV